MTRRPYILKETGYIKKIGGVEYASYCSLTNAKKARQWAENFREGGFSVRVEKKRFTTPHGPMGLIYTIWIADPNRVASWRRLIAEANERRRK